MIMTSTDGSVSAAFAAASALVPLATRNPAPFSPSVSVLSCSWFGATSTTPVAPV